MNTRQERRVRSVYAPLAQQLALPEATIMEIERMLYSEWSQAEAATY
jgi:hypothetical protein